MARRGSSSRSGSRWPAPRGAILAATALVGLVSGCGSSGAMNTELASSPVPPGKARLTIVRTEEILYMAVPAAVEINGKKAAGTATAPLRSSTSRRVTTSSPCPRGLIPVPSR